MPTYFLATTVDTDDPADAIAIARLMDPPDGAILLDELRIHIRLQVERALDDRGDISRDGQDRGSVVDNAVGRIVEAVTQGTISRTTGWSGRR